MEWKTEWVGKVIAGILSVAESLFGGLETERVVDSSYFSCEENQKTSVSFLF